MKRIVSGVMLTLLLIGVLILTFNIKQHAQATTGIVPVNCSFKGTMMSIVGTSMTTESNSTIVYIDPQNVTVHAGENFNIYVKISNVTNLYGLEIGFSWDPNILKYINHTVTIPVEDYPDGVLHKPVLMVKNEINESGIPYAWEPGTLAWIAYACLNPAPSYNGSGTVLKMTFKALKAGVCDLNFTFTTLVDRGDYLIAHDVEFGHVKVAPFEHDVSVSLDIPPHITPGSQVYLNATIYNAGLNNETNVELQILINGSLVNSIVISLLAINASQVLSYLWIPTIEAYYNVTAYAPQVSSEENLMNNVECENVFVSECIGVPIDYPTIQKAIDIAYDGATIYVGPGTYFENLVIDKSLKLVGSGSNTTVIDGNRNGIAIVITATNVVINSFTIKNAAFCCVYIKGTTNVVIRNNIIKNTPEDGAGIYLRSSSNNTILHNTLIDNGIGICLDGEFGVCSGNIIKGNNIITSKWCGILTNFCEYNEIYYNNLIANENQMLEESSVNIVHHNYWDDYTGRDLDGDGIGDTLLPHQGVDYYPLMEPWKPLLGDVNFDDKVNIRDIVLIASIYGSREGDLGWIPEADIAPPYGIINIYDLVTCAYHYGEEWKPS